MVRGRAQSSPDPVEVEDGPALIVKNTFFDFEEQDEMAVRSTKSLPALSFKTMVGDGKGILEEDDLLEESEASLSPQCSGHGSEAMGTAAPDVTAPTTVHQQPSKQDPIAVHLLGRIRAVRLMIPDESLRLSVKNTFFCMDEAETPPVRPTKSMPISFKPEVEEPDACVPLCPTCAASDKDTKSGITEDVDAASLPDLPARCVCRLRTGTCVGLPPEGPHLGRQRAPSGQALQEAEAHAKALPRTSVAASAEEALQHPGNSSWKQSGAPEVGRQQMSSAGAFAAGTDLHNCVWRLAQDPQGCRQVQSALDDADSDAVRKAIAMELRGHVLEASRNPHANYVLQKCILVVPPEAMDFVLHEFVPSVASQTAKHKFGCRIIQRLVEKWPAAMLSGIVEAILLDFAALSRHPYGNYVIQKLLENGNAALRQKLTRMIELDIRGLSADSFGCTVVGAALTKSRPEEQVVVARALLHEPGLLVFTACTRHGHFAAARALKVLQGRDLEAARLLLSAEAASLRASRFGRNVVQCL